MAKWDECVPEWKAAYISGMSFPDMSKKFGVHSATINSVLTRHGVHKPVSQYERQQAKISKIQPSGNGLVSPRTGQPEWKPRLEWKPIESLANKIVLPGIEKHLEPLLHYKGSADFGRVHRLWNFAIACMLQGCEEMGDITKMSHHPDYSHLCGTTKKQQMSSAIGFMNRLRDNPVVTNNVQGMTEWAEHVWPNYWKYPRISKEAGHPNCAWWRIYKPKKIRTPGNIKQLGSSAACYPFIAHDPKKEGMDLVQRVNNAVPKHLPDEFRADVCQDLICAILAGEMSIDDLQGSVKEFTAKSRKLFSNKWEFMSIDAPIPGMDGRTFNDVIASDQEWEFG